MTDPRILVGDCREQLANIATGTIDAIITDPPYELGFMGKTWDASGVAYDQATWAECLRVLKPGGHLCAFGGTRTYHRMTVAIEDAGFEIRDSIHWIYGSGFPKSLDVSKAIDKAAGAKRPVVGQRTDVATRIYDNGQGNRLPDRIDVTAPATEAATAWDGWGTALKPAHEPIILARKPLIGTVAANVLEHGTGALNINASRIGDTVETWPKSRAWGAGDVPGAPRTEDKTEATGPVPSGRWPANLLITHAHTCTTSTCAPDCPALLLDAQSGTLTSGANPTRRGADTSRTAYGTFTGQADARPQRGTDTGGASRFFTQTHWDQAADLASFRYVAKPSKRERNAGLDGQPARAVHRYGAGIGEGNDPNAPSVERNTHPTVKPVALIRWLCRLVTPPGGTILDPFLGSGTTAVAATLEGHPWTGCELTDDYFPIIEGRVAWAERHDDTAVPTVPAGNTNTSTATTNSLTLFEMPT